MASEMVKAATSKKLKEVDWAKNLEICELVVQEPWKAKDVIKSIKKFIGSRCKNTQLYAVTLLEMLMNNCRGPIYEQVIDNGLLPILVEIVKTEVPVRELIFNLLDATQISLGAKTKFPQYYEAYNDLVSAGVQFLNRPNIAVTRAEVPDPETRTEPNKPSSDTSIIRKASSVMEVPRDVLNSRDPRQSEAWDVFEVLAGALTEAELLKKEAYEESTKRQSAERALEKAKEMIAKQAREIEEMKLQHDAISNKLDDIEEQKLAREQQITEMESALKTDNEKLQQERDAAVTEAEGLRQKAEQRISMPLSAEALITEFSSYELEQATQGFSEALKIGKGGFGKVYKGFLWNTTVAIKMLQAESMQGPSEFNQEIAVLSRVRHPNLVTLIGSCPKAFGLVYEFLPNGSLEDRLACKGNTPPLTWQVRTRIIFEMCSVLIFLQSNRAYPVVHGDLTPDNILLDANFVSKLGDFGICQLLSQSGSTKRTTTLKGTFAYLDPEFLTTGELTPQSDVYSFGIIILQLLTGRPAQGIAKVVEDVTKRGELRSVLDPTAGSWPFVQANQLAHIGLRCVNVSRQQRPDLAGEVWKVVEPLVRAASLTAARPSFSAASAAAGDDSLAPSYFFCPISLDVMSDPQFAADGYTYEAKEITGWFDCGHDTSPMIGDKLVHCNLTPNRALHSEILQWRQQL